MATIIAALIAAVVAVTGWFIGSYLIELREDRTRRLQLTIDHSEKQISEFYAPLLGLLEQLDTTYNIKEDMVKQEPEHRDLVERIVYKEYFFPIHQEIGEILKHKIHLLEGNTIPESERGYFKHFTSENIYWRLKDEPQIVSSVKASDFPEDFSEDMQHDLAVPIKRYDDAIQELRHGAPPFWSFWRHQTSLKSQSRLPVARE
jgi:hypothetical protein